MGGRDEDTGSTYACSAECGTRNLQQLLDDRLSWLPLSFSPALRAKISSLALDESGSMPPAVIDPIGLNASSSTCMRIFRGATLRIRSGRVSCVESTVAVDETVVTRGETVTPETKLDRENLRADLRRRFSRNRGELLPVLHHIHDRFGHLPGWAIEVVGWSLGVPSSQVYGAATSYSELRIEKSDDRVVRVCTGLSCIANGAAGLTRALESATGSGATDRSDGRAITVETTSCRHLCALAPAVHVDRRWQGRVTPELVAAIVQQAALR
ncbi:MAG: hypothetical protein CL694_09690 [Chloroflexi bacterium]|nr:hypothetical protein [Chloroflexota bacterium]